ncbi:PspC domain-containing protein [Sinomonas sp. P10A9]|uniref:PspC domain-containing protein n=1 Tax=Sinomonas puerhi TaxID=3238584 RepID=A0AB39L0Q6_9MICC
MSTEHPYGGSGTPSPGQPSGPAGADFFAWIRGLGVHRGPDRWVGGVASGLAHRWGVDPILVRGLFVVASIFLGVGLLVYGLMWLLLPEPDGRIHVQEAMQGHWTAGMTGGLVSTVLGLGGTRTGLAFEATGNGPLWGAIWGVFWVAVTVLIVVTIARSRRSRRGGPSGPSASSGPPAAGMPTGDGVFPASVAPAGAPTDSPPPLYPPGTFSGQAPQGPAGAPWPPGTEAPEAHYLADPRYGQQPSGATTAGATAPVWVRPHRPGPGGPFATVVVGLAVLVAGTLLAFQLAGNAIVDPASGALWAIAGAIIGLGIVVAGIRGRTGGILSFFAVVALASAAITQPAYQLSRSQGAVSLSPTTVAQATSGYSLTGASGQLDLRGLDSAGPLASEAVVPVHITLSDMRITVPKDVPVRVEASATLSNVHFGSKSIAGITAKDTETYNADKPGAVLVVKADVTLANLDIRQEQ